MPPSENPNLPIETVLARHQRELMRIEGIVGVYQGLMDDEQTSCIKVMLKARNPSAEKQIPRRLGGFDVIIEISGEIVPFQPEAVIPSDSHD